MSYWGPPLLAVLLYSEPLVRERCRYDTEFNITSASEKNVGLKASWPCKSKTATRDQERLKVFYDGTEPQL